MALHCLSAAPGSEAFSRCLSLAASGDAIILMGDACYAILPDSDYASALSRCPASVSVLAVDAATRGLSVGEIQRTNSEGFVALTEAHQQQLAWY